MEKQEILTIISLVVLALALLSGLGGIASKNAKTKEKLNQICALLVFLAVVLIGVSQLTEEGYDSNDCRSCKNSTDCRRGESCTALYRSPGCCVPTEGFENENSPDYKGSSQANSGSPSCALENKDQLYMIDDREYPTDRYIKVAKEFWPATEKTAKICWPSPLLVAGNGQIKKDETDTLWSYGKWGAFLSAAADPTVFAEPIPKGPLLLAWDEINTKDSFWFYAHHSPNPDSGDWWLPIISNTSGNRKAIMTYADKPLYKLHYGLAGGGSGYNLISGGDKPVRPALPGAGVNDIELLPLSCLWISNGAKGYLFNNDTYKRSCDKLQNCECQGAQIWGFDLKAGYNCGQMGLNFSGAASRFLQGKTVCSKLAGGLFTTCPPGYFYCPGGNETTQEFVQKYGKGSETVYTKGNNCICKMIKIMGRQIGFSNSGGPEDEFTAGKATRGATQSWDFSTPEAPLPISGGSEDTFSFDGNWNFGTQTNPKTQGLVIFNNCGSYPCGFEDSIVTIMYSSARVTTC